MVYQTILHRKARLNRLSSRLLHHQFKRHQNQHRLAVRAASKDSRSTRWVKHFCACLICTTVFKPNYSRVILRKSNGRWMRSWFGRGCIDRRSLSGIRTRTMPRLVSSWERFGMTYPPNSNGRTSTKRRVWRRNTEQNIQIGFISRDLQNDAWPTWRAIAPAPECNITMVL